MGVLVGSTYPEIQGSSPEAHSPEPILKEWRREKNHERWQVEATSVRSRGVPGWDNRQDGGNQRGVVGSSVRRLSAWSLELKAAGDAAPSAKSRAG